MGNPQKWLEVWALSVLGQSTWSMCRWTLAFARLFGSREWWFLFQKHLIFFRLWFPTYFNFSCHLSCGKICVRTVSLHLNLKDYSLKLSQDWSRGLVLTQYLSMLLISAKGRGLESVLTSVDFSQAFDTVNFELLLAKLRFYKFDDVSVWR